MGRGKRTKWDLFPYASIYDFIVIAVLASVGKRRGLLGEAGKSLESFPFIIKNVNWKENGINPPPFGWVRENNSDRSGGVGHCSGLCLLTRADFSSFKTFQWWVSSDRDLSVLGLNCHRLAERATATDCSFPRSGGRLHPFCLLATQQTARKAAVAGETPVDSAADETCPLYFLQRETSRGLRAAAVPVLTGCRAHVF